MLDLKRLSRLIVKTGVIIVERETEANGVLVRVREVHWQGNSYFIVDVNGDTCRLERIKRATAVADSSKYNMSTVYNHQV